MRFSKFGEVNGDCIIFEALTDCVYSIACNIAYTQKVDFAALPLNINKQYNLSRNLFCR